MPHLALFGIVGTNFKIEHGEVLWLWVECYGRDGSFLGEFRVGFADLPYRPTVTYVQAWIAEFNADPRRVRR